MFETLKLKDLSFEAVCAIIAQVVHAANRQYAEAIGGRPVNPTWEQLPEEQKQSLMKAVRNTVITPQTLEDSHEAWCIARMAQGYTKGNYIDHIRKTHPNLVPFNELPFEEQLKDALFLGITSIFASALGLGEPPEAAREEELLPAGEGDGELMEGAETIGEAAERAQETLDNIPDGQGPVEGYVAGEEGYEAPDDSEQGDGKLAVAPEDVLDPDDLQNPDRVPDEHPIGKVSEPTQAPEPKPNLPDEDVKPAKKAKKAKKKQGVEDVSMRLH